MSPHEFLKINIGSTPGDVSLQGRVSPNIIAQRSGIDIKHVASVVYVLTGERIVQAMTGARIAASLYDVTIFHRWFNVVVSLDENVRQRLLQFNRVAGIGQATSGYADDPGLHFITRSYEIEN